MYNIAYCKLHRQGVTAALWLCVRSLALPTEPIAMNSVQAPNGF